MKASHWVLAVMAAMIVIIGIAAAAGPPLLRMVNGGDSGDGRISIAIATPSMLDAMGEIAQQQREDERAAAATAPAPQAATPADASAERGPTEGVQRAEPQRSPLDSSQFVTVLSQSSTDGLANELSGRLNRTGRFAVKDGSQFARALQEIRTRPQTDEDEGNFFQQLRFWERRQTSRTTTSSGEQRVTESHSGGAVRQVGPYGADDLQGAGRALNVDYVLVVAYRVMPLSVVADDGAQEDGVVQFNWEPVLIYRVFNVRTGDVVLGEEVVMRGIRLRLDASAGAVDPVQILTRDAELALNDRIGQVVTRNLLNTLAPARIVSVGDSIALNRGSNDGVVVGQEYDVEREGEEVRDGNVRLGAQRTPVGRVRVTSVQERFAQAEAVDGDLQQNDVVLIAGGGQAVVTSNVASRGAGPQLGEGDGLANERPALAVGEMRVEFLRPMLAPENSTLLFTRGISGALANSDQVEILTRSDLARLQRERDLTARAQGIEDANLDIGLATAGHVLTGEVQVSAAQQGETVSVGGQSRTTNVSWRLTATGRMRVQTLDGRTVYDVPVRTQRPGSPNDRTAVNALIDAFSADAAAALLVRMYPIRVVQISGDAVILNRGPEAGMREGTRLRAYRVDPVTRTRAALGDLVVTDAAAGYNATARFAGARFNVSTGDNVQVEVISGGVAPSAAARRARAADQAAEPESQVRW